MSSLRFETYSDSSVSSADEADLDKIINKDYDNLFEAIEGEKNSEKQSKKFDSNLRKDLLSFFKKKNDD